jgi:hypothetical protein
MDSVHINVYTTINAPVITIEQSTSNVEVLSQLVDTPVTIDVTDSGGDNSIDVTPIERTVVIDATTAGATPLATPTVSGRMRLYTSLGTNTDGTIEQATITENFELAYAALGTRGTSVIDFGLGNMSTELEVTGITQALTTSNVTAHVRMEATPEHPVDDLLIDPIRVMIKDLVNGVGFTIFGAMDNAPANGTYKIDWSLTN